MEGRGAWVLYCTPRYGIFTGKSNYSYLNCTVQDTGKVFIDPGLPPSNENKHQSKPNTQKSAKGCVKWSPPEEEGAQDS